MEGGSFALLNRKIEAAREPGEVIIAQTIDASGNTSEFSYCYELVIFQDGFESGDTSAWSSVGN